MNLFFLFIIKLCILQSNSLIINNIGENNILYPTTKINNNINNNIVQYYNNSLWIDSNIYLTNSSGANYNNLLNFSNLSVIIFFEIL